CPFSWSSPMPTRIPVAIQSSILALLLATGSARAVEDQPAAARLKQIINAPHAVGADYWIYNDFQQALVEAKRTGKPIFVTFRCVPCKACSGFEAEVAKGSEVIAELARDK